MLEAALVVGEVGMGAKNAIEVLYTERCQYVAIAIERVRHALSRVGRHADFDVRIILVSTFDEAVMRGFRGSPTVRVDGQDVETRAGVVAPIGLHPRGYIVDGRLERAPTQVAIERAVERMFDGPRLAKSDRLAAAALVPHAAAGIEK